MLRQLALHAVALLVLMPSTLGAAFWSLMGAAFAFKSLSRGEYVNTSLLVLLALAAGWFGIVTLWRTYYGLANRAPFNRMLASVGLACGSAVSLALVANTGGTLAFRLLFFGWPLLAVLAFIPPLIRTQPRA